MKTDLLKALVKEIIEEATIPKKKLFVFDFDDTIAKTECMVRVKKTDGSVLSLTSDQYAKYHKEPDDEFDMSDYLKLIKPKEIAWITKILRNAIAKRGADHVVILTARRTPKPIEEFFKKFNIPPIKVVVTGVGNEDAKPSDKANWILSAIKKYGYDTVEFFDDSQRNIAAVSAVSDQVPETKIITRLVRSRKQY